MFETLDNLAKSWANDDNDDSISRCSDGSQKYNPNRPRDRAPSVISGHSKASEQSRQSNASRKSNQSGGSMKELVADSKKDLRDSLYESCITGGPLGPARTKDEIRNRKTLLISIVTGLFLVVIFLILKEVAYNKQKAKDDMEIEELEGTLVNGIAPMMGAVPMNNMMGMMQPGQMYMPGMPHPGLQVPLAHNPMIPSQMQIMQEQHRLLQQMSGGAPRIPQNYAQQVPHPAQQVPMPVQHAVQPVQHLAPQAVPQPVQHLAPMAVQSPVVPQQNLAVPQAMAQVAVNDPAEQLFIQNEGTREEVDRFANMYIQIETLLASFVDTISSYTTDLKQSGAGNEGKALDLLNEEKIKMIKFLTKEEQHFQKKVSKEKSVNDHSFEKRNARKKALLEGQTDRQLAFEAEQEAA